MQGHGLGRIINKELEKIAAGKNIHELFLLTTTAKKFFEHAEFYIWKYKNYFLRIRPYKLDEKINNPLLILFFLSLIWRRRNLF